MEHFVIKCLLGAKNQNLPEVNVSQFPLLNISERVIFTGCFRVSPSQC